MYRKEFFYFSLLALVFIGFRAQSNPILQDDSLSIYEITELPIIDGNESDKCWEDISWQSIDMVWIPWNGSVSEDDFTGKFKVVWSSVTNLMYYLVQVTDDVIVDHFQPGGKDGIHQFDIIEVFIDENRSKGKHVFDTPKENAENAFGYHIWTEFPESGMVSTNYRVQDLAGTSWSDMISIVYTDHFPELALRENNKVYTWEFSMKVYDDTYDHKDPEKSRVILSINKIMGLSLAYCDNDDLNESPALRDNFYGSVYVPEKANNSHWEDAEYFGLAILKGPKQALAVNTPKVIHEGLSVFGGNNGSELLYSFSHSFEGIITVSIFDMHGKEVSKYSEIKHSGVHKGKLSPNYCKGIHFLRVDTGKGDVMVTKFVVF
jgi:hypothetical protein